LSHPPRRHRAERSPRKTWLFRAAALGLGVLTLVLIELSLAVLGLGAPKRRPDPFVGFTESHPLFVHDPERRAFVRSPAHRRAFRPASFPDRKGPDDFRIFCLGGSTVQGRPYEPKTAFSTWLELALEAADPSKNWQVINCGGISYASYRLAPIALEVLDHHEPDLLVIYTGHNEFLEDRTYRSLKRIPDALSGPIGLVGRTRTFNAARGLADRLSGGRIRNVDRLGPRVDAILDYEGGLDAYDWNPAWREHVIEHFAFNLERMVTAARKAGVPVILCDPAANLETAPFKSRSPETLGPDDRRAFERARAEAFDAFDTDLETAVAALERAIEAFPTHAETWHALGLARRDLGQTQAAIEALVRAKDLDVCPLRILEAQRAPIRMLAERPGVFRFDAQALFAALGKNGLVGDAWLLDHVHPSIKGHRRIALALFEIMRAQGWTHATEGWADRVAEAHEAHRDAVPSSYLLRGRRRLRALEDWARGRGFRPSVPNSEPAQPAASNAAGSPEDAVSAGSSQKK